METIFFEKTSELKREKEDLENRLRVKITLKGKNAIIEGDSFEEYEAQIVLDAMSIGFSAKKALKLLDENIIFRKIPIKKFTRRKDLRDVRARIIGKDGKTKRTIEEISGCDISLQNNTLGIIGSAESIETATIALTNIIKGSKQANVYHFLERINTKNKSRPEL